MRDVDLGYVVYTDRTGYATHVQIELIQYIGGVLRTTAFVLPVRNGTAELRRSGARQVISIVVQPVISTRPGVLERLGTHASYHTAAGEYLSWARVETSGQIVHRTIVRETQDSQGAMLADGDRSSVAPALRGKVGKLQVSFQSFEYYDVSDGGADKVVVTLTRAGGIEDDPVDVDDPNDDHKFEFAPDNPADIIKVVFQPYSGADEYGNEVKSEATQDVPPYYLTHVIGRNIGTADDPVNTATKRQAKALPPASSADGDSPPAPALADAQDDSATFFPPSTSTAKGSSVERKGKAKPRR